ncbi:MAG TPA: WG repeat-containing protein [Caldithrix sp.]|nr:WG repeat-containing protein [Caldithrix sp.]
MKCIKFGKLLEDDSKFCIYCGEPQQSASSSYSAGNLTPFNQKNKWGFKDKDTRDIFVQPKCTSANEFIEKRAVVQYGGKYGSLDENGKEIIRLKYDRVFNFRNGYSLDIGVINLSSLNAKSLRVAFHYGLSLQEDTKTACLRIVVVTHSGILVNYHMNMNYITCKVSC